MAGLGPSPLFLHSLLWSSNSPHTLHIQKPCPKMLGCICFSVNTLLSTPSHPPKRLRSKGDARLNCIFQSKTKKTPQNIPEKETWHSFPSKPPSQLENWGVMIQSTKVCTAPFLEIGCLDSCYSKCSSQKSSAVFQQLVGAQLGVSTAGQMLQSRCTGACADVSEPRACRKVLVGRAGAPWLCCSCLVPCPRVWERVCPDALHCLRVALWFSECL